MITAGEKNPAGQGERLGVLVYEAGCDFQWGSALDLIEKMTFEQRLDGGKDVWRKSIPRQGTACAKAQRRACDWHV